MNDNSSYPHISFGPKFLKKYLVWFWGKVRTSKLEEPCRDCRNGESVVNRLFLVKKNYWGNF